jgi:SPOR domain
MKTFKFNFVPLKKYFMKVLNWSLLFVLVSFHANFLYCQGVDTGKVEIVQDFKVKELLAKHVEINSKASIKGYRIKIHFGADKNQAYEVKRKFSEKFPDAPAYVKYDQPNFNVRVGDFRTKLEAYKFLKELQVDFPSAFLVQDDIEFPVLESSKAPTSAAPLVPTPSTTPSKQQ